MAKITWDKYSLLVDGKRLFLRGGEFHYWRVPDRTRWRDLLEAYAACGLNAVRIYFHWGYHSPDEGVYHFNDNRDVEYLLDLCAELGLWVLCAPGPYICAETQAGGFPPWLVAKRHVRVKHLKATGRTRYDEEYAKYCEQWLRTFYERVARYQTTRGGGPILAVQIENEYFERVALVKGSRRYVEELVRVTRDCGVDVPTFHNDAWEVGSWNGVVDLYGFDKYVVFAPSSHAGPPLPPWKLKRFKGKVDSLEEVVRGFGGAAAGSPLLIPELQGGWFNHWAARRGYDDLYDFYDHDYQKVLLESVAAQGVTAFNLYMFYGGTNWGTLGDPDVYTSYDYSAAVREFGFTSERYRKIRQFNLFVQSFEERLAATERVEPPWLSCDEPDVLHAQRRSAVDGTDFYFLRNFNPAVEQFALVLPDGTRVPGEGAHRLPRRSSFVAVGNFTLGGANASVRVVLCTLPVLALGPYAGGTLLVVEDNGGELLLEGSGFKAVGTDLTATGEKGGELTRCRFSAGTFSRVTAPSGHDIFVVCLSKADALTFNAKFDDGGGDLLVAWGAHGLSFAEDSLLVEAWGTEVVHLLTLRSGVAPFEDVEEVAVPGLKRATFVGEDPNSPQVPALASWERAATRWDLDETAEVWKPVDHRAKRGAAGFDPLDHHFTSGHVLYKCAFEFPEALAQKGSSLKLTINMRHKCALWLNGSFVGGHDTYSHSLLRPGAKNGPDPTFLGAKTYDLTPFVRPGRNVLLVLTESLGLNRIPFVVNDVRNPRGILKAKFSRRLRQQWHVSGVDVRELPNAYQTTGFPGERRGYHLGRGEGWEPLEGRGLLVRPDDQVTWFRTTFDWKVEGGVRQPLRLRLRGKANANAFLNGVLVGRYWGEKGPQHDFYLPDGLLADGTNRLALVCWTRVEDLLEAEVLPYVVDPRSGNVEEESGVPFRTRLFVVPLE